MSIGFDAFSKKKNYFTIQSKKKFLSADNSLQLQLQFKMKCLQRL